MRPAPKKVERLEARVSREQKHLFQHAAAIEGLTLTDYVVTTMQKAALRTVTENQALALSSRDQEAFAQALINPPEPNPRLAAAYESYVSRREE